MVTVQLIPDLRNICGGPGSFQRLLARELRERAIQVSHNGLEKKLNALLLINATRHWGDILLAKKCGIRIVQRLGSPYAVGHNLPIKLLNRIRIWGGTQNVVLIRRYFADSLVYQSQFVKECWEKEYGHVRKTSRVIYNGVDLNQFTPDGPKYKSQSDICIISVEGTQLYPEQSPAFLVAQALNNRGFNVELLVFGKPWGDTAIRYNSFSFVKFKGIVPNEELSFYYRGATLYVLNDIVNAGCPNSVLEALACGTPVLGYSPGVLPEILNRDAGTCVPAIGDPWKGKDPGNVDALADAAIEIVKNNPAYRKGARQLAEDRYDLNHMVDQYMEILFQ